MSFKKELEKMIKENFYDDHENCDDSCGKKADYTELITSIINLVDKVIGEDETDETDKWTPEMESYIRQARQVVYGRNALKAKQRNKLRGEIDGN